MINILTDSTSDLSPELRARYNIDTIPLSVILNERVYRDQVDITLPQLYESVTQTGKLPKTSAPSVAEFLDFFNREGQNLFFSISSRLSTTYQNAVLASEMQGGQKPYLIDSLNLSTGIGLLALKAAELREMGKGIDEIERSVREAIPKVKTSFIIDTFEFLYMGGRCSAMQSIVSSLLKIRPVIEVCPEGTLGVKAKTRGTRAKGLSFLLDSFKNELDQVDLHRVFITHTGCDEDAEYLKGELLKIAPIEEVCITVAGCVVASHCGPNTIGVLYLLK